MPRGGKRTPANPASVSGPGKLSRRTDGGPAQKLRDLPNAGYGEAKSFSELQQAAPLAQTPSGGGPVQSAPPNRRPVVPFGAPSERPDQPVTAGAPVGPGPGPESLGLGQQKDDSLERFRPMLPVLTVMANRPGASEGLRTLVKYLKGTL